MEMKLFKLQVIWNYVECFFYNLRLRANCFILCFDNYFGSRQTKYYNIYRYLVLVLCCVSELVQSLLPVPGRHLIKAPSSSYNLNFLNFYYVIFSYITYYITSHNLYCILCLSVLSILIFFILYPQKYWT